MKRIRIYLYYSILLMFCLVGANFTGVEQASAVNVNDFYFESFDADYFLTHASDNTSRLKVVENVTVVFPDYEQNKGICRQIPFTNQNGENITLPSLTSANLKLLRNGEVEPIYSIEKDANYYDVCTGNDDYVLGKQKYAFEYEFENVVTEFSEDGREWQELYWDSNGNGATQRFDAVTARVHFESPEDYTGKSWCYVGKYGESDSSRCTITKTSDGVMFEAKNLSSYENLTFDVELKNGSFAVVQPKLNYTYVWLLMGLSVICALCIVWSARKFAKTREKANYYKGFFVKPEYQPHDKYSLPELAEIYLGKKKDAKVGMLLELLVKHNIALKKEDKKKWSIEVKSLVGVPEEYMDLLAILNGGMRPSEGDNIEVKRRSATNGLVTLRKSMESKILGDLKRDELVEKDYRIGNSGSRGLTNVIAMTVVIVPVAIMIGVFVMGFLNGVLDLDKYGEIMVFKKEFYVVALVMIVVTSIVSVFIADRAAKYSDHTKKGLEAVRYMDGLKLYIEMAEAERLKMFQSVKGADTSPEGIVKLYEKLLPYSALFGLEESWMNEMKEYCELEEIEQPDYLLTGLMVSDITRNLATASSVARTSTVMSSSGGGSSSGFSGGGGGGFSGGGGGGGGFSGR